MRSLLHNNSVLSTSSTPTIPFRPTTTAITTPALHLAKSSKLAVDHLSVRLHSSFVNSIIAASTIPSSPPQALPVRLPSQQSILFFSQFLRTTSEPAPQQLLVYAMPSPVYSFRFIYDCCYQGN
ncbi:hypothetical protein FRB95_014707 [Tulasnella sp. JGI-2019a]|nr:hypothetical protein FRB95_014707 [Tulasnella sp. JGI-2019a]